MGKEALASSTAYQSRLKSKIKPFVSRPVKKCDFTGHVLPFSVRSSCVVLLAIFQCDFLPLSVMRICMTAARAVRLPLSFWRLQDTM